MRVTCEPLTSERWRDFERLFGNNGACGGCWCMLWRRSPRAFQSGKGAGNKQAMHRLVRRGVVPGLLAYRGDHAIGWCALAPRTDYPALKRSRVLQPVDDVPCWSVACLFIHTAYGKQGVATALLNAAAVYAKSHDAPALEGYPVAPKSDQDIPPVFAWTGTPRAFERAGFREVLRRSRFRPIMRRTFR